MSEPTPRSTIAEQWELFVAEIVPTGMTVNAYRDVKRTFYSGAICTYQLFKQIEGMPAQDAARHLNAIGLELQTFGQLILTDKD